MPEEEHDVFISYKKEEADKAQRLLEALEAAGYSAVYDVTGLNLNDKFADKLEALIRGARRVVVLWTERAAKSDWVRDEARLARDLGKYLGVVVDAKAEIALDLRNLHKIDIARMEFSAGADVIVEEVRKQLGRGSLTPEALAEANFFRAVDTAGARAGYEAFLAATPSGRLAEAARRKLAALPRRRSVPVAGALALALGAAGAGFFAASELSGPDAAQNPLVVSLKDDLARAEGEAEALTRRAAEAETLERRVADLTSDLERRQSELATAQAALTNARSEMARLSAESERLQERASEAEGLRETLRVRAAEVARLTRERDAAREAEGEAQAALAEARERIAALEAAPAQAAEPYPPECRKDGEDGIMILDDCVPLSTTRLDLSDKEITDASPLSGLTALKLLYLGDTLITDASPLSGLTALTGLSLYGTQIADASPLSGLTALKLLYLGGTQVSDLGPLRGLSALNYLIAPDGAAIGDWRNDTPENRKAVADYIAAHSR